ncbi:hypothetical protein CWC02_08515 [Pseudoalteromonas sp. S2721]|uniref:hypothetical protein n=1 Tax=Pseudoalteromonas sp. S2721 TaxID=579526 RepID=UPI00110AA552|nr:hypothetical protein [Pseudoalteromonas sp. S2721]TMP19098.1 hypothetical protein CWC02_08515 [Pseudoalteromonas sp. S2721]
MKSWLKNNKIYFETLAPVCISLAALFVALASYKLADQQLILSAINVEPNFYLKETYLYDPVTKSSHKTELSIYNSGEGISNFTENVNSLLVIEHFTDTGKTLSYIPIIGYYDTSFTSTEPKGELAIVTGYDNNAKFSDIYFEFQKSQLKDKYGFVFISLKHATKITYTNKLGVAGETFFIGTKPVNSIKYREFMSRWNANEFIDLDDLSLSDIEEKLQTKR